MVLTPAEKAFSVIFLGVLSAFLLFLGGICFLSALEGAGITPQIFIREDFPLYDARKAIILLLLGEILLAFGVWMIFECQREWRET